MEKYRRIINAALGLAAVAIAGGVAVYLVGTRPQPPRRDRAILVPEVDLFPVQPCTFDAPVVGHGTVRGKSPLRIVPEVGGRLVYVNEGLAVGKLIEKGGLLFEIDSHSYQLKVAQAQAEIRRLEAQAQRHRQEETSLKARLAVARDLLEQAQHNVERERALLDKDATRQIDVEKAQDAYLRQKEVVLGYQSQLDLMPHLIAETQALLDLKRAQLAEARRRVERTKIYCPFDARVESISAAESQVVFAGFAIATLTNMEALELTAGVDPRDLEWTNVWDYVRGDATEPATPPEATITWSVHDREYTWRGTVTRLERVDETTRTARVVIEIKDVMEEVTLEGGQTRPPLSVGMFCRVEIPAQPLENALVVPRSALQDGNDGAASKFVYVFEPDDNAPDTTDGRLGVRRVPVLRTADNMVLVSFERSKEPVVSSSSAEVAPPAGGVVRQGPNEAAPICELQPGDQVVVSPLPWAVEGMRLRRRRDVRMARIDAPTRTDPAIPVWPADPSAPGMLGYAALVPGDF